MVREHLKATPLWKISSSGSVDWQHLETSYKDKMLGKSKGKG